MANGIVQYMTDHGQVELSQELVKRYLVSGDAPKVTDQEVNLFIQLCRYQQLNPFLREAYLVKFGDQPAQIITGKEVFTKRAARNGNFLGFDAGVIVQVKDGATEYRPGAFVGPGETLLGGWAKVYVRDREKPIDHSVSMAEYNKGRATWKDIPATMIRKVALVQALREAFPEDFQGLTSPEEVLGDMGRLNPEPVKIGEGSTAGPPPTDTVSNSERWRTLAAKAKFHGKTSEQAKAAAAEVVGMKPCAAWTPEDFAEIERRLIPADAPAGGGNEPS